MDDPHTVDVLLPAVYQEASQGCLRVHDRQAMQVDLPFNGNVTPAQLVHKLVLDAGTLEN